MGWASSYKEDFFVCCSVGYLDLPNRERGEHEKEIMVMMMVGGTPFLLSSADNDELLLWYKPSV